MSTTRQWRGAVVAIAVMASACVNDWSVPKKDAGLDDADLGPDGSLALQADGGDEEDTSAPGERPDGGPPSVRDDAGNVVDCVGDRQAECEPGETVACTTACGTSGNGDCTASCEPPTMGACVPPSETCNGIDDDCDGLIDSELLSYASNRTRAWGGPSTNADDVAEVVIAKRSGGGGWLFVHGPLRNPSPVNFISLNAQGAAVGGKRALQGFDDTNAFVAASTAGYVATVSTQGTPSAKTVEVHLFSDSDLQLQGSLVVANDPDPCSFRRVSDVAVRVGRASGAVEIAWIETQWATTLGTNGACDFTGPQGSGTVTLRAVSRAPSGSWSAPVNVTALGTASFLLRGDYAAVEPWPCEDAWALARTEAASGTTVSKIGVTGSVLEKTAAGRVPPGALSEAAFAVSDEHCDDGRPHHAGIAVLTTTIATGGGTEAAIVTAWGSAQSSAFVWSIDGVGREIQELATELYLPVGNVPFGVAFVGEALHAIEISNEPSINVSEQVSDDAMSARPKIPLAGQNPAAAVAGLLSGTLLGGRRTFTAAYLGNALSIASSRLAKMTPGALDGLRVPGDSESPLAVSYAMGCEN